LAGNVKNKMSVLQRSVWKLLTTTGVVCFGANDGVTDGDWAQNGFETKAINNSA